jgi:hypothetical protein
MTWFILSLSLRLIETNKKKRRFCPNMACGRVNDKTLEMLKRRLKTVIGRRNDEAICSS